MAEAPETTGFCRNCGRRTGPRFCGHCGQPADDRRRPLLQVLGEILDDWLSVDSRLLTSLAALARPGRLTLLHRDGKRAPYLRPLRLYLLASLALFSTLLTLEPTDASRVDLYIGDELITEATSDDEKEVRSLKILEPNSVFHRLLRTRWSGQFERFRDQPPQQLLDSLFGSLRRYLPAALVLFVPFLAAGLKLLYWKTGTLYVDHLVFSLHFQSALFIALAVAWLITWALQLDLLPRLGVYVGTGMLMMTAYLGMALARVHRQGRWRTVAKTVLVLFVYTRLLSFSVGLAVAAAVWRA